MCRGSNASMDEPELRADHSGLSGAIDGTQHRRPKTPARWQQRVVLYQDRLVLRSRRKLGAAQMPIDFTADLVKGGFDVRSTIGALLQDDLAHNGLDVLVRQRNLYGETVRQLLQRRSRRKCRLPGGKDQNLVL